MVNSEPTSKREIHAGNMLQGKENNAVPRSVKQVFGDDMSKYHVDEMELYDVAPVPVSEILLENQSFEDSENRKKFEKATRSRGAILDQTIKWQKKDVVTKGVYKPWFFSRFARLWVPLGKPQCLMDLKHISNISARMRRSKMNDDGNPKGRSYRPRSGTENSLHSDDSEGEDDLWVGCDGCGKWRIVPPGIKIDQAKSFYCNMLEGFDCDVPEEPWDKEEFESSLEESDHQNNESCSESQDGQETLVRPSENSSKKRKSSIVEPGSTATDEHVPEKKEPKRAKRNVAMTSGSVEEPLSPEDITACSSLYGGNVTGGHAPTMSRLDAVVRVLRATGKALHYDILTRQALKLGLIKFTGSQGTAGESMKAFLNKTIRENKTAAIVNLGKGVYGLKEWEALSGSSAHAADNERGNAGMATLNPTDPVSVASHFTAHGDTCKSAPLSGVFAAASKVVQGVSCGASQSVSDENISKSRIASLLN
mmetsp:Transcript_24074/g.54014  ORF Transcript_24074/g.54014 Transcript_24074/m.54014 type:complete len:480 (-) Transcript_24074:158-1597(-)